ncbi:MAG: hypothetical protein KDD64_05320 [Bdellovibrionales bacterium]|nr:hypothetical protein [Bdellovibrionales bacterium]
MNYVFYTIWGLIPLVYFLLVLWSRLEQSTHVRKGKKASRESSDLFRQAIFVSACALVTFLVDYFFVDQGLVEDILPEFVPLGFIKLILFPIVLMVLGKIVGGSKPIRIEKAPRPTSRR